MVPFSHTEDREIEKWILNGIILHTRMQKNKPTLLNETFLMSAEEYNLIHDGSSLKYECHVVFTE